VVNYNRAGVFIRQSELYAQQERSGAQREKTPKYPTGPDKFDPKKHNSSPPFNPKTFFKAKPRYELRSHTDDLKCMIRSYTKKLKIASYFFKQ
jgi:hypothetical protein